MRHTTAKIIGLCILSLCCAQQAVGYPLYGSEDTGMLRLIGYQRRAHPEGELLHRDKVDIRLADRKDIALPEEDASFDRELRRLLHPNQERYQVAVLDLTDPDNPRYAEHRGEVSQNPGSVGKIVVGLAVFQALADAWPEDEDARFRTLSESMVTADQFIISDSHKAPFYNPETEKLSWRPIKQGDTANLFTYLDWMYSASSNAAAAMCLREAMLIKQFGREYPIPEADKQAFFRDTPKKELSALLLRTMVEPLEKYGIDTEKFRQGSFFTRKGKSLVPGVRSYGTAREMLKFMLYMEQGKLIDEFSSREMKRLLYMTQRRIRYASSPALAKSAVYFKSGSLYKCKPEEGFKCGKYKGNVINLLNSVCTVESPAEEPRLMYISVVQSNVLRENSAVAHQTLGTFIHRLIERMNPQPKEPAAAQ